jgi:cytochrome c peroxidase
MTKRLRYCLLVVLVIIGLALAWWHFFHKSQPERQTNWQPPVETSIGSEPISPIPLELNLDLRKVALGQRLFNDTKLSQDNTISCASCHSLVRGGVDNMPRSVGIGGALGNINAPTVFNSGFNYRQFWDGRAATLEDQVDGPVQNPKEMGANWPELLAKLSKDDAYRTDFTSIYLTGITHETVKDAIATFERSLTTPNSKFDRFLRGEKNALTGEEFAGYNLFKKLGCISCHQGVNVGGNMYEKLGLVDDYYAARGQVEEVDYGRYNLTKNEDHRYEFRVPSLRNVVLTAPYFHDASADTLEHAVAIMGKYQLGLELKPQEISKIVLFLNTLTGDAPKISDGVSVP